MRRILLLLVAAIAGCGKGPAAPPPVAEKPRVEAELARITLPRQACKSLGVQTAPIRQLEVQEQLPLPGWVMARQGHEVTLTAELAGYIGRPASDSWPTPGGAVKSGQELLTLAPVLTPLDQVQLTALKRGVENELAKARDSVTLAETELKRVLDLQRQGLRGQQEVEQAQAKLKHVKEDQSSAEDKIKLFAPIEKEAKLPTKMVKSPLGGQVLQMYVNPGQYVPAAAPLVTIADLSQVWLRVPIPESDLHRVDVSQPVTIALVVARPDGVWDLRFEAQPLGLVPLVDPVRHTADLLYTLDQAPRVGTRRADAGGTPDQKPPALPRVVWAKDQMIKVHVPFGQRRQEIVVPYSALVYDAFGGAWIYVDVTPEKAKEHLYERRRIDLGASLPEGVAVRCDGKPGDRVVVAGAGALFSREFFKPPIAAAAGGAVD